MGRSMAKGSESPVSDKILGEILWMYMYNEDASIRTAAKSAFIKHAPKDAKKVVRDNWRMKYRTQSFSQILSDTTIKKFRNCNVGDCVFSDTYNPPTEKNLGHVSVIQKEGIYGWESDTTLGAYIHPATLLIAHDLASTISIVEPFCKELKHDEYNEYGSRDENLKIMVHLVTVKALGMICDEKSVPYLIQLLKKTDNSFGNIAKALGKIGDSRAVDPLIKILDSKDSQHHPAVAKALGKIGDKRAVGPLEKLLKNKDNEIQQATSKALNRLESIE